MDACLSIIICTYVRTHRLIECLRSIEEQSLDASRFEVVVVSRGISGKNEKRLRDFTETTFLTIKRVYVPENRPGISAARNAGLQNAKGLIIHFLDEDTLATPGCLKSYVDIFNSTDALCIGGKILPKFSTSPPRWLQPSLWPFLGTLDVGENICSLNYPTAFPVGANVAFRREVFERFGLFDEDLGILGRKGADGDETDLCYRIQTAGGKLLYSPKALIYHLIEADKLNKKWMFKRALRQGKGAAMLQLKHSSPLNLLMSNLMPFLRRTETARETGAKSFGQSHRRNISYFETKIALALGYVVQMAKALLK